jgi:hypothetical protein
VQGKDLQSIVENASRQVILLGTAAVVVSVCHSAALAQVPQSGFEVSFSAGLRDDAGRFMGGTEMRVLAAHGGRLYAGNGYWEDQPGSEGPQGAQILVLDGSAARWRVDHGFDERMADGRPRDLAVSVWKRSPSRPMAAARACRRRCSCSQRTGT